MAAIYQAALRRHPGGNKASANIKGGKQPSNGGGGENRINGESEASLA